MVSNQAVVWLPIQMTLIHRFPGITVFKYCHVGASTLTPVLPKVSPERNCIFDVLFTRRYIVDFEANVTPGHGLLNWLRHVLSENFLV
jgi:hypothetical protein